MFIKTFMYTTNDEMSECSDVMKIFQKNLQKKKTEYNITKMWWQKVIYQLTIEREEQGHFVSIQKDFKFDGEIYWNQMQI